MNYYVITQTCLRFEFEDLTLCYRSMLVLSVCVCKTVGCYLDCRGILVLSYDVSMARVAPLLVGCEFASRMRRLLKRDFAQSKTIGWTVRLSQSFGLLV